MAQGDDSFSYVGRMESFQTEFKEGLGKTEYKVKTVGAGPDGHVRSRTLSFFDTTKKGDPQPWMDLVQGAAFATDPAAKVLVWKGWSKPSDRGNPFWNVTKVERFDPNTYEGSRDPHSNGASSNGGAGAQGAQAPVSPDQGQLSAAGGGAAVLDDERWAVEIVLRSVPDLAAAGLQPPTPSDTSLKVGDLFWGWVLEQSRDLLGTLRILRTAQRGGHDAEG